MKIETPFSTLKAASLFAATNDIRYYLQGVCVETTDKRGALLIATDGHTLALADVSAYNMDNCTTYGRSSTIIPLELIMALKAPKQRDWQMVTITVDGDSVALELNGATISGVRIDGKFPDWRLVIPLTDTDPALAHYDPRYVARVEKAGALLGNKCAILNQRGDNVGFCALSPSFLALVMPVLHDFSGLPDWKAWGVA